MTRTAFKTEKIGQLEFEISIRGDAQFVAMYEGMEISAPLYEALRKKLVEISREARAGIAILILAILLSTARAQEKISPAPYWSAVGVTAGMTFLDAGTTSLIKTPACHEEIGSAWLYGANPQPARTFLQMGAEVGAAAIAAHVLRKHHSRLWIAPLAYLSVVHGRAGISNLRRCE